MTELKRKREKVAAELTKTRAAQRAAEMRCRQLEADNEAMVEDYEGRLQQQVQVLRLPAVVFLRAEGVIFYRSVLWVRGIVFVFKSGGGGGGGGWIHLCPWLRRTLVWIMVYEVIKYLDYGGGGWSKLPSHLTANVGCHGME